MQKLSFIRVVNDITYQSCTLCTEFKELTSSFHKDKKEAWGYMKQCKQCRKDIQAAKPKARKRYYKLDSHGDLIERECTKCRVIKAAEHFYFHKVCPGNRNTACKVCASKECKRYNEENRELSKKSDKAYYKENSERIKVRNKVWKKANRLKCTDYDKRINRQAPIHKNFSKDMRKLKQELKELNKQASTVLEKKCLDHIIPIKHDLVCGLNVPWNMQHLPWSDNSVKSNKFDGTNENESWKADLNE